MGIKATKLDSEKVEAPSKKRGLDDIVISKQAPEEMKASEMVAKEKRERIEKPEAVEAQESGDEVPEPAKTVEIEDDTLKPYEKLRLPSQEDFCPIKDSPQKKGQRMPFGFIVRALLLIE